jgi:hypothetical protein
MIPTMKLAQTFIHYRRHENAYEFSSQNSEETRLIKAGSTIFCRCFEMRVEMSKRLVTQTALCG